MGSALLAAQDPCARGVLCSEMNRQVPRVAGACAATPEPDRQSNGSRGAICLRESTRRPTLVTQRVEPEDQSDAGPRLVVLMRLTPPVRSSTRVAARCSKLEAEGPGWRGFQAREAPAGNDPA